jgi:predicted SnoaL-like aldol condensation-catalyzing enzyme
MAAVTLRTVFQCAIFIVPALAQQPAMPVQANPAPGCSVTPAELEANKKVVIAFFTPGVDRVALADSSYKQHNPAFKKRAEENHVTDYEEYKAAFSRGPGQGPRVGPNGQRPPAGNPLEVVTAECDLVTVVHRMYRPDPNAEGKFYEAFGFDTFRVKNGKLVEHWDDSGIPPAAARRQ